MTAQTEPLEFIAGDTIIWEKSLSDYPADDSWVLSYAIRDNSGHNYPVTAAASGDKHLVTITAATSAAYVPGTYSWQSYVTKSTVRHSVASGSLNILPNFATATGDLRSNAKRILDAVEAVLEGQATTAQQEYTIQGRSLKKIPIADLIVLRDKYASIYQSELAAERIKNGLAPKNKILVRL